MSEQLKRCSICGSSAEKMWDLQEKLVRCTNRTCHNSLYSVYLNEWQERPIEDELQARIAALEAENAALREYRDGHNPKVDFPPDGMWVNMRYRNGQMFPVQYSRKADFYFTYRTLAILEHWYTYDFDLVRWYPIPPLLGVIE